MDINIGNTDVAGKALNTVMGMSGDTLKIALGSVSGIASDASDKLQALMDSMPELRNYEPEDPFEEEDKKLGISRKEKKEKTSKEKKTKEKRSEILDESTDEEPKTKTRKLKEKFQEGVKDIIPGLNIDDILDKLADKCKPLQAAMGPIKDSIYNIKENKRLTPEEKEIRMKALKEQRQEQIKAWKESQKDYVMHVVNDIKADFGEIKFGVENLTAIIPIITTQINLPTFIGTGAPNPARIAADFLSYKHLLQSMAHPIQTAACKLLDNCDRIGFDLPDPVLKVVETVSTLSEAIDKIPG